MRFQSRCRRRGSDFSLSIAALLVACAWQSSNAQEPSPRIFISSVIPYESKEVGNDAVQASCDWNRRLSRHIVENSKGLAVATDADLSTLSGRKLSLSIVNVHAIGGAAWTGPKWAILKGELTENGKLIGSFEKRRTTTGGVFTYTACATLEGLGKELGEDVGEWLQDPTIADE